MKKPKPSNKAQEVSEDTWFHEYRGKIDVIHNEKIPAGYLPGNIITSSVKIPWKTIMESARRCRPEEFE